MNRWFWIGMAGNFGRFLRSALMGPSSYLVNVTSPAVVDAEALARALVDGSIAGAAMDVHDAHPIPPGSPFIGQARALLTPHTPLPTQRPASCSSSQRTTSSAFP